MPTTTPDKAALIDAAVAVVERRAQQAIDEMGFEYVEAYAVCSTLKADGLLTDPDLTHSSMSVRDKAQRSLDNKVKRLLDEEAAKPDARILRFSSHDHRALPRLSGVMRPLYGNAVGYITPDLYKRCQEAVAQADTVAQTERAEMDALLNRALRLGLPAPTAEHSNGVTYDREGFAAILDRIEGAR